MTSFDSPVPPSPPSPDLSRLDASAPGPAAPRRQADARDARGESGGAPPGYPAAGYPDHGPVEGEGAHLLDYVRVLYRRRYVATTAFLLVLVLVTVYTFTRTPVYQASAQIEIDYESPKVVPFQQVTDASFGGWDAQEYYQTQYQILQSRSLARRTIDAARLWNSPLLARQAGAPAAGGGFFGSWLAGGPASDPPAAVKKAAATAAGPGAPATAAAAEALEEALVPETPAQTPVITAFLRRVTVSPVRNSRLVDVKFSSTDPRFAALVANAMAKAYIEQSLEYKFLSSKEASDWLQQQLAEQRKQVEASEQALQRYREQTDSLSLEDKQNIVVQKLSELNAAVTQAKTLRLQKEAIYEQVKAIEHDRAALDTFPLVLSNPFIQQLKAQAADLQRQRAALSEKYGEKHPEMIRLKSQIGETDQKIQAEIAKIVQSIRADYESALAQERTLAAALEQQKTEAMSLSRKGIDYGVLQRDASTNRQMFDALLQRAKETGVSAELKSTNIRVVDAATVPTEPVSPRKLMNMVLAVFGGGIFAVGLAFFFEYLDNRVKSPEEVKHYLGLPFLGLVPVLEGQESAEDALLHAEVPPGFAEAFRGIRTNVLFSSASEGGRSVVVTSTGPGEGKTLVATNLSVALAQAGQRVLLVDADMRKARVHEVFHEAAEPGLSNVLVGTAKASEAVRRGPVENLWLLLAGVTPPNPAELLASRRFKEFLSTLEQHFDWVVVDTPPVMAVTDAAVAAHVAQGVVFVVRSEHTNKRTAMTALEQLDAAKAKFLGGVLNRVDVQRNSYYYSNYYRKSYSSYYGSGRGSKS